MVLVQPGHHLIAFTEHLQGSTLYWKQPSFHVILQADFFGLPGLADKASAGLEADPRHGQGEAGGPSHAAHAGCQYDSVYLETGFHPVKSEFNVLQQQQAATMEVTLPFVYTAFPCNTYQQVQGLQLPS